MIDLCRNVEACSNLHLYQSFSIYDIILGFESLEDQVLWSSAGRHSGQLQTIADMFVKGASPLCLIHTAHVQVGPAMSLQLRCRPSRKCGLEIALFLRYCMFSELPCAWQPGKDLQSDSHTPRCAGKASLFSWGNSSRRTASAP